MCNGEGTFECSTCICDDNMCVHLICVCVRGCIVHVRYVCSLLVLAYSGGVQCTCPVGGAELGCM